MSKGIVDQIQTEALNKQVPVADLLRKVKYAAAKLGLDQIESWVENELKGYKDNLPDYRKIRGSAVVKTLYHGTRPLQLSEDAEFLNTVHLFEPIASIEHNIATKHDSFLKPFPAQLIVALNKHNEGALEGGGVQFSASALAGIVDAVRTLVLEWSLSLEKAGIRGTSEGFGKEEVEKAQAPQTIINIGSIESFAGNLGQGNVSGTISVSINLDEVHSLVEQLRPHLDQLTSAGATEIEMRLSLLETELQKAKPQSGRLKNLLNDMRMTLSAASGNLISAGAIQIINQLLGTGVPNPS